jgi:hypothetical protein
MGFRKDIDDYAKVLVFRGVVSSILCGVPKFPLRNLSIFVLLDCVPNNSNDGDHPAVFHNIGIADDLRFLSAFLPLGCVRDNTGG